MDNFYEAYRDFAEETLDIIWAFVTIILALPVLCFYLILLILGIPAVGIGCAFNAFIDAHNTKVSSDDSE